MVQSVVDSDFENEVLQSELPVLVDFWAAWCQPCRMIAPIVEELAGELEGKMKVCKCNVDEAGAAAARYGVMAIPTLAVFSGGELVERIVGVVSKEELRASVDKLL